MTINATYGAPHPHHHARVVIDATHANAHSGWLFRAWQKNADGAQVADDAQQSFVIDLSASGVGEDIHLIIAAIAGGDSELQIWEGITYSGGSDATLYNMHRTSSHTMAGGTVVVKTGCTITTAGKTQLDGEWVPGGVKQQALGGGSRGGEEWILAAGKVYAVILINRAGSAKDMSLRITCYED